jgi:hypothetical protein
MFENWIIGIGSVFWILLIAAVVGFLVRYALIEAKRPLRKAELNRQVRELIDQNQAYENAFERFQFALHLCEHYSLDLAEDTKYDGTLYGLCDRAQESFHRHCIRAREEFEKRWTFEIDADDELGLSSPKPVLATDPDSIHSFVHARDRVRKLEKLDESFCDRGYVLIQKAFPTGKKPTEGVERHFVRLSNGTTVEYAALSKEVLDDMKS